MVFITLYMQIHNSTGPTLSGSFVCCNFMHDFLIRKFQNYNPWTGFLALYMPLFYNNYWSQKCCICFAFATFYKHPLSGSFLDRHGRFEIPHYKTFTNVRQNLAEDVTQSPIKWFVVLLWFSLQRSFLFPSSSQMF